MTRTLTIISCLLLLLFCTLISVRWGLASAISFSSREQMSEWRQFYRYLNEQQWQTIRNRLSEALVLNPGDPDLLQSLAAAYENEYVYSPTSDVTATEYRNKAKQYYQASLNMRPSWPHHWVDLTLVKYRLGELDDNFYLAMSNAIMLGPWEPWVQRIVADIGMHNWQNFQPEIQSLIKTTVQNGVRHRDGAQAILELVKRYRMFELICTENLSDATIKNFCDRQNLSGIDLQMDADIAPDRY